jgi:hypothetical protein
MADLAVQQSHSEILRRIDAVEDKFENRIRSLEARMEACFNSLEGRLDLRDRKLLSMDTRIDNNFDGCFQILSERTNDIESRTSEKCNQTGNRLVQIEDKWQKLPQCCCRGFQKLEMDVAELKTSLRR